jgi:anti-sigma-K factor RskA
MSVPASSVQNSKPQDSKSRAAIELELQQACREAVAELKFRREAEATLKAQVDELKSLGAAKDERIGHLEAAIAKYEAAVQARSQAETFVSELRSNYERQVAVAEKQLAVEQQKTNFWRTISRVALVAGIAIGAAIGYAAGNR